MSRAAPPPAIVVVLPTSAADDAAAVERLWSARAAVRDLEGLALVDVVGLLGAGDEPAPDLDGAKASLEEARAAFEELDVERAADLALAAAGVLSIFPDGAADARVALELLERACGARRDDAGASRAIGLLRRLDPDYAVSSDAAPTRRKADEAARAASLGLPGRVRVETFPLSGALFVDGRWVGASPALLTLSPGPHLLVVDADGYRREVRVLQVPSDGGLAVELEMGVARKGPLLSEIGAGLADQAEQETIGRPLRDVRSLFLADQAILLAAVKGVWRVDLYDLKAGRRVRRAILPADRDPADAAAAAVRALYRGLDPRAPGLAAPDVEPEPVAGTPYYRRWWFWAGVAAGVVTAVAVPIAALSEDAKGLKRRDGRGALILRF